MANDLYNDLPLTSFPQNIDSFTTWLNVTAQDGPLIQQYITAMNAGNQAQANQILSQISSGSQKIIKATDLNKLTQAILAVERFYSVDIKPYVQDKQEEWLNIINQFTYVGAWSNGTAYVQNNIVSYIVSGVTLLFIATSNPPTGTVPTNTQYWRPLSVQGTPGESGPGLSYRQEWNSSTSYSVNDCVTYSGAVWMALQANQNSIPGQNESYWKNIISFGAVAYPIQDTEPTGQAAGGLWFNTQDNPTNYVYLEPLNNPAGADEIVNGYEAYNDNGELVTGTANYLPITGGTMTGPITLAADPAAAMQPVTKRYSDTKTSAIENGLNSLQTKVDNLGDTVEGVKWSVGDVKYTARTDMDSTWILCDGTSKSISDFPDLADMLPFQTDPWETFQLESSESSGFIVGDNIIAAGSNENVNGWVLRLSDNTQFNSASPYSVWRVSAPTMEYKNGQYLCPGYGALYYKDDLKDTVSWKSTYLGNGQIVMDVTFYRGYYIIVSSKHYSDSIDYSGIRIYYSKTLTTSQANWTYIDIETTDVKVDSSSVHVFEVNNTLVVAYKIKGGASVLRVCTSDEPNAFSGSINYPSNVGYIDGCVYGNGTYVFEATSSDSSSILISKSLTSGYKTITFSTSKYSYYRRACFRNSIWVITCGDAFIMSDPFSEKTAVLDTQSPSSGVTEYNGTWYVTTLYESRGTSYPPQHKISNAGVLKIDIPNIQEQGGVKAYIKAK